MRALLCSVAGCAILAWTVAALAQGVNEDAARQAAMQQGAEHRGDGERQWQQPQRLAAGPFQRAQLVSCALTDGQLAVSWIGPLPDGPQQQRFGVEGSSGFWTMTRSVYNAVLFPGGPVVPRQSMVLQYFDPTRSDSGDIHSLSISLTDEYVSLSAQYGSASPLLYVAYFQQPGRAFLRVSARGQRNRQVFAAQTSSLLLLQRQNPREVHTYLAPVLRLLGAADALRPGAADVYRLFPEIAADATSLRAVQLLLPHLDAPGPAERASASAQLETLGRPGILAALRLERRGLSPEQRQRLDAFVTRHSRRDWDDLPAAREDVMLLADCLLDEDALVRAAARAALTQMLNHPVPENLDSGDEESALALARFQQQLRDEQREQAYAATAPSTRPASPEN